MTRYWNDCCCELQQGLNFVVQYLGRNWWLDVISQLSRASCLKNFLLSSQEIWGNWTYEMYRLLTTPCIYIMSFIHFLYLKTLHNWSKCTYHSSIRGSLSPLLSNILATIHNSDFFTAVTGIENKETSGGLLYLAKESHTNFHLIKILI